MVKEDQTRGVGADAGDLRLIALILRHDRDLEGSVSLLRRDRLSREARVRVPECAELPRFVSCTNWDHQFREGEREVKTRWAFDRRLWSVVVLHVQEADGAWRDGVPNEMLDVTESLALANSDALLDVEGWGCVEGLTLPLWANEAGVLWSAFPLGIDQGNGMPTGGR